jgi:hypothetical protein
MRDTFTRPISTGERPAVNSPEHYRRKGQEAVQVSAFARDEELRGAWLDMARAWFELADFYEKNFGAQEITSSSSN